MIACVVTLMNVTTSWFHMCSWQAPHTVSYYTGWVPDLQSGGCWFESRPGLLHTKLYWAFHPSGVGKWVPAAAGKAKAGMAHSDCGWTCGCADKTVKSLENTCHTWALLWWWFTVRRGAISSVCTFIFARDNFPSHNTTMFSSLVSTMHD